MTESERWRAIKAIFDAAVNCGPADRAALLQERCGDDVALRSDVEALLTADSAQGSAFERPWSTALREHAVEAVLELAARSPTLTADSRFGPYQIRDFLGAGSMGEVYRAHDPVLGRDVAVKVIPEFRLGDGERRARFEREARVLAALNHPNIAVIYGIEACDGVRGLVLELVEGETLADRIARNAARAGQQRGLSLSVALNVALQIADALQAAHDRGIVHRDLKPANIKITPEGHVKVLDFGIAKAVSDDGDLDRGSSGRLEATGTSGGAVLGTAAYMSPEQALSEPVDRRTDVWAFGCVLYEMLTGRRAFAEDEWSGTVARVVHDEPDFSLLPPHTPHGIRGLVKSCLTKDRDKRLSHVAIARFQIEEAVAASDRATARSISTIRRVIRVLLPVFVAGAVTGWAAGWIVTPIDREAARPVTRLVAPVFPADSIDGLEGRPTRTAFALSPDGRTLVFSAMHGTERRLYVRHLADGGAVALSGTEGAESPFFSPDGTSVGYWAAGEIRRVPLTGGPSVRVARATAPFGISWGDDDRIVFAGAAGGLWEVPAQGGTPATVSVPARERGDFSHRLPHVLPGGDAILFTITKNRFPRWDETDIAVYERRTGAWKVLIEGGADARYVATGHLVYAREGVLLAAPFDLRRLERTGKEIGVLPEVMQAAYSRNQSADTGAGQFCISTTGTLVYVAGGTVPAAEHSLVWVDRRGRSETLPITARAVATARLSPDGQRIALSTFGRERDIWVYSIGRGTLTRLAVPGRNGVPVWSGDGGRLIYAGSNGGLDALNWTRADGAGAPEVLFTDPDHNLVPAGPTPHGSGVLFYKPPTVSTASGRTPPTKPLIWALDAMSRGGPPVAIRNALDSAGGADISADGRWIAYHSAESGQLQVYVQAYPGGGERQQISVDGGISPVWRRDGRELFYVKPNVRRAPLGPMHARVMAVPVATQPTFWAGSAKELFAGRYMMNSPARAYDVTAPGDRFLLIETREQAPASITHMIVVENWFTELSRLTAPK